MKQMLRCALMAILLFIAMPQANAGFFIKQNNIVKTGAVSASAYSQSHSESMVATVSQASEAQSLPRGRGSGKKAGRAFMLAWVSIFPILGLIAGAFAVKAAVGELGKKRKYRGFAIAALALVLLTTAFSIAILTV